jgi:hypothetical protein
MNPSYPIVFYVSGHGLGHTSRSVEVIDTVLRRQPAARIIVKTSAPKRPFERKLAGRIEFFELECDTGVIQIDSLSIDVRETVRRAKAFQQTLHVGVERSGIPATAIGEPRRRRHPSDGVTAAALAESCRWRSGISHGLIYEAYPEESTAQLADDIAAYRKATKILRLPIVGGFSGSAPSPTFR